MSERPAKPPSLKEGFPSQVISNDIDLESATLRYRQLIDRREKLEERSAFGILALNAGSIAALLSALNGNGLAELGLRKAEGAACLAFLLVGMIMALASIYFDNVKLTERACEEFRRLSHFRRTAVLLELPTTTETMDRLGEQIKSLDTVLPQDFEFSPLALHLLHGAGGAWLAAVTLILIRIGIEAVGWF